MNQSVLSQELVLNYKSWKVLREIVPMSFCHPCRNPTEKFFSGTSFKSRCVSHTHMKIANVCVGTIHRNVRIALQFSYQFAIFISVCNFHISLQFSYQFSILTFWCIVQSRHANNNSLTVICIFQILIALLKINSTFKNLTDLFSYYPRV